MPSPTKATPVFLVLRAAEPEPEPRCISVVTIVVSGVENSSTSMRQSFSFHPDLAGFVPTKGDPYLYGICTSDGAPSSHQPIARGEQTAIPPHTTWA
ncbi:hypothetical protein K402DRAFT_186550 [Aulographum hederae CBS 113979]|uniref:Uncharacterized protein n=1 Tax=Aulographum hederae CBS 113979 TaxID=1176131 RepID=A0A6G1GPU0_9PEZI|nr:hypothetical protein K402DRAFT_186550 [Aulographum hederae CBS 113979]